MAFGATITVTVNAVAQVLNRINQDQYGSEWLLRTTTEEYRCKIRHSQETNPKDVDPRLRGMDRHNVELTHTVFATSTTPQIVRQAYSVYRVSPGDDMTAAKNFVDGFTSFIDGSTVQTDVLAWLS
jgi:hypothetical protein